MDGLIAVIDTKVGKLFQEGQKIPDESENNPFILLVKDQCSLLPACSKMRAKMPATTSIRPFSSTKRCFAKHLLSFPT